MRILVVSDSHGVSSVLDEVLTKEPHDLAVHLGDHMLDEGYMNANFDYWVGGNNDFIGPDEASFTIEGVTFYLAHGHMVVNTGYRKWLERIAKRAKEHDASVALFGHSHFPERWDTDGCVVANPGSVSLPRPSFCLNQELRDFSGKASYLVINTAGPKLEFVFKTL